MVPKGWPPELQYLSRLEYARECPQETVRLFKGLSPPSSSPPPSAPPSPCPIPAPGPPSKPGGHRRGDQARRQLADSLQSTDSLPSDDGALQDPSKVTPTPTLPATESPVKESHQGQPNASAAHALLLASLTTRPPVLHPPGRPCKLVRICTVTDPQHPVFGQRQLCAAGAIPKGALILDYLGVVRLEHTASKTSDYIIRFGDGLHGLSIDAERAGNEGRFVNDYRGVARRPNAEFDLSLRKDSRALHMSIWALQPIAKGEEILVSYGKGFWHARASGSGQ